MTFSVVRKFGTDPPLVVYFQEVVHTDRWMLSIRPGPVKLMLQDVSVSLEDRMKMHKNARLTPKGRETMVRLVVDEGMTPVVVARQFRTTPKTVAKWVKRFRELGVDGLHDRSSRPHSSPSQTPLATRDHVERLRRDRYTQDQIASVTELSRATDNR